LESFQDWLGRGRRRPAKVEPIGASA